ncbi:MAG: DUF2934 domain-containing protein [Candidatus Acidiferrum sp.]
MAKTKATSSPTVKKPAKAKTQPTYEEIALRAYHIYLERGSTPGDGLADWLRAERELTEELGKPGRKTKVVSIAA